MMSLGPTRLRSRLNRVMRPAWFNKGYSLAGMKRYDEAIVAFDKVQALRPDYPNLAGNHQISQQLQRRHATLYQICSNNRRDPGYSSLLSGEFFSTEKKTYSLPTVPTRITGKAGAGERGRWNNPVPLQGPGTGDYPLHLPRFFVTDLAFLDLPIFSGFLPIIPDLFTAGSISRACLKEVRASWYCSAPVTHGP